MSAAAVHADGLALLWSEAWDGTDIDERAGWLRLVSGCLREPLTSDEVTRWSRPTWRELPPGLRAWVLRLRLPDLGHRWASRGSTAIEGREVQLAMCERCAAGRAVDDKGGVLLDGTDDLTVCLGHRVPRNGLVPVSAGTRTGIRW